MGGREGAIEREEGGREGSTEREEAGREEATEREEAGREEATEREEGGREGATEREVASSPGPTQILSRSRGEKSPQLRDEIWVGPGDEAKREEVGEKEQQREEGQH